MLGELPHHEWCGFLEAPRHKNMREYVRRNEEILRTAYGDRFIAVVGKVVVGSDRDEFVLAKRVQEKFNGREVLIGTIEEVLNRNPVYLESPEVER
ncbi:MAG: hypothetical protein AABW65_01170 [Nanoarchaeota archaeon]